MNKKNNLKSLLNKNFLFVGQGNKSPFYDFGYHYSDSDLYWLIPNTKFFVTLDVLDNLCLYEICNNPQNFTTMISNQKIFITNSFPEKFIVKRTAEDFIQLFGKQYNFLLYHMDHLQ